MNVPIAERNAYLLASAERRRAAKTDVADADEPEDAEAENENGEENGNGNGAGGAAGELDEAQHADLAAREEFILAITEQGFGKRTSSYRFPITARGGQGRDNIPLKRGQGNTIAVFPVADVDQIMLVSNGGMVIRVPVAGISIRRRHSGGVLVFKLDDGERVVSAARFPEGGETVADETSEESEII